MKKEPDDIIREWLDAPNDRLRSDPSDKSTQEYLPGADDDKDWIPEEVFEELGEDLEF